MDEVLILERAKSYLGMLSKGIDPISGSEVPNDSVLSSDKLKKCFEYVCGVLQKVIDNDGQVVYVNERQPFSISEEKKRLISLSDIPITSTEFVKKLNLYINSSSTKRLTSRPVMQWLLKNNYIGEKQISVQLVKKVNIINEESAKIGLEIRKRIVKSTGEVKEEFVFTKAGQQFILDHIDEIVSKGTESETTDEEA